MNQDEAADSCWLRWRWLSSGDEQGGASTSYTSMQKLKQDFALIDISEFQRLLGQKGFELVEQGKPILTCRKGTLAWCIRQETVTRVRVPRTRRHSTASRPITDVGKVEAPDPA